MGGSQSCSLCPDDSTKREVLVMKEDGESIKFKEGTSVKDVLATNPYHKVIRCCSDRSVLLENCELNANWLYFLLPKGLAVNDATYRSLIRAAMSKELIVPKLLIDQKREIDGQEGARHEGASKVIITSDEDNYEYKKSQWKPALNTIKEAASPPLNDDV